MVYLVGSRQYGWFKIGATSNLLQRYKDLAKGVPFDLELLSVWSPFKNSSFQLERELHARFNSQRIKGEWFRLTEGDIEEFDEICRAVVCREQNILCREDGRRRYAIANSLTTFNY